MNFSARLLTAGALLAIAVAAVGCGETVIDNAKAAEAIESDLEKSLHEKIKAVECPSDLKVEVAKTFTCTVVYQNGKQATATLKIRNKEADVSFVGLKLNK
jgi:predicted ATP-binding protein involved in virulence